MRKKAKPELWLTGGLLAGTALGWLTAPRRGDWLRNQIRQKFTHWRKRAGRRISKRSRDLENRARGGAAEVRNAWAGRPHYVDANTLVDQVHSQIGRAFAATLEHANLNAVGHTIFLHGVVPSEPERARLIQAIGVIEGVDEVNATELRVEAQEHLA